MWPDSPYAVPIPSYVEPVEPPLVPPDVDPVCTISINRAWLPFIRGSLKQLLLQTTWVDHGPDVLNATQGQVFSLIDLFADCSDTVPIACPEYFTGMNDGGFSPVVDSSFTYAVLGIFGWEPGYHGSLPAAPYWQMQIIKSTAPIHIYSMTVVYTATTHMNFFDLSDFSSDAVDFPPGVGVSAYIPIDKDVTSLRPVGTTLPISAAGTDFFVHSISYSIRSDANCP
jgi:hypothetical protein